MRLIDALQALLEADEEPKTPDKTAIGKLADIVSPIKTQIQGELASDLPMTSQVFGNLFNEFTKGFASKASKRGVKVKYQWHPSIEAKNYPDVKALDTLKIKAVDHATAQGIYDLAKHSLVNSRSEIRKSRVQGDVFIQRFIGPYDFVGNDSDVDEWAIGFLLDVGGVTEHAHVMLSDSQQVENLRNRYRKNKGQQADTDVKEDDKVKRTINVVVSILEKAEYHSKEITK